jgi:hypothetical protein
MTYEGRDQSHNKFFGALDAKNGGLRSCEFCSDGLRHPSDGHTTLCFLIPGRSHDGRDLSSLPGRFADRDALVPFETRPASV